MHLCQISINTIFATYIFENCTEGDKFLYKVFTPFKSYPLGSLKKLPFYFMNLAKGTIHKRLCYRFLILDSPLLSVSKFQAILTPPSSSNVFYEEPLWKDVLYQQLHLKDTLLGTRYKGHIPRVKV